MESWTEIRCPACVGLGWNTSRLLLKIHGKVLPNAGVVLQLKCHRCKSLVEWTLGTPVLVPVILGERNHRKQIAAFE